MKKEWNTKKLCEGIPKQIITFFDYCRKLNFTDEPDYNYLMTLLNQINQSKSSTERDFEWNQLIPNDLISEKNVSENLNEQHIILSEENENNLSNLINHNRTLNDDKTLTSTINKKTRKVSFGTIEILKQYQDGKLEKNVVDISITTSKASKKSNCKCVIF